MAYSQLHARRLLVEWQPSEAGELTLAQLQTA
jgi:hypothetical protein